MSAAGASSRPLFLGRCAYAAVCLLICAAGGFASAATFTANPVRIVLPPGATSTSLLLENKGTEAVLIQADVMAWSQNNGKDVLTPSEDLVVSPPIFKVAPGASQTVRVGLLRPAAGDREVTYRLFLQEVAQPPPPGMQGVAVALRLGLPVFVQPRKIGGPQLTWRACLERDTITLILTNSGNVHVQALDCTLIGDDGSIIAEPQLAAYVLAGQTRSWQVRPAQPWRGKKLRLKARTDGGEVTAEITPE